MIKHYFIFGTVDSRDYDIWLSAGETEAAAERDLEFISVPGRNGDLIVDNGRYKNISVPYTGSITHDFVQYFGDFRAALLAQSGYQRLEDSVHPDYYRLATYAGPIEPDTMPYNVAGSFEVLFNAKPQRYLKSGEHAVHMTAGGTMYNQTGFEALPRITLHGSGSGSLNVGGVVVGITALEDGMVLDCDLQDAYLGTTNKNSAVSAQVFPTLKPGSNAISWSGGITSIDIIPRWWTL